MVCTLPQTLPHTLPHTLPPTLPLLLLPCCPRGAPHTQHARCLECFSKLLGPLPELAAPVVGAVLEAMAALPMTEAGQVGWGRAQGTSGAGLGGQGTGWGRGSKGRDGAGRVGRGRGAGGHGSIAHDRGGTGGARAQVGWK